MTILSPYSIHIPTYKECARCRFRHDCNSGEMCKVNASNKTANRSQYERERYLKKKEQKNVRAD